MAPRKLTIATRSSPLAMRQTEMALAWLKERLPETEFVVREMSTTGDQQSKWSLEERGGEGLFVKELEEALRSGQADIAVHSAKDLPARQPEDLELPGYLPRGDVHDVLVVREDVQQLRFIATSSPRRRAQLKGMYPCAVWSEIRGNVQTRLKKLTNGKAEATVLAAAGLNRLGLFEWPGLVFKPFCPSQLIPAAGQGAIALQTRRGEGAFLEPVLDAETREAVETEKAVLAGLGGGCHTSIGVYRAGKNVGVFHEELGLKNYTIQGNGEALKRLVDEIRSDLGMEALDDE